MDNEEDEFQLAKDKLTSVMISRGIKIDGLDEFLENYKVWMLPNIYRENGILDEVYQKTIDRRYVVDSARWLFHHNQDENVLGGSWQQGKSQVLHFVYELLRHCGERVIYIASGKVDIEGEVQTAMSDMWIKDEVSLCLSNTEKPLWIIVDELKSVSHEIISLFAQPFRASTDLRLQLAHVKWIIASNKSYLTDRLRIPDVLNLPPFPGVETITRTMSSIVSLDKLMNVLNIHEDLLDRFSTEFNRSPGIIMRIYIMCKSANESDGSLLKSRIIRLMLEKQLLDFDIALTEFDSFLTDRTRWVMLTERVSRALEHIPKIRDVFDVDHHLYTAGKVFQRLHVNHRQCVVFGNKNQENRNCYTSVISYY